MRGLSEANGSWNTICIDRRCGLSWVLERRVMSSPSRRIWPRGRLDQPQHAARHRRFAATGLADETQRLADANRERDAVDRVHGADLPAQHAGAHRIVLDEVGDLEQRRGHATSATSAARQQAARWPPPQSSNGG